MRRRPNPYRVLAHALDVGDMPLVELLEARLFGRPRAARAAPTVSRICGPSPGAEAAIERLLALLAISRSPD